MAWTAARAKVDSELDKLSQAITAAADGEPGAQELEDQFYGAIAPLLDDLDDSLGDVLDRAASANAEESVRRSLQKRSRRSIAARPWWRTTLA